MNKDSLKQQAAEAAMDYVRGHSVVGVGTGSTVNFFIEALESIKGQLDAVVPSSQGTEDRLRALNIPIASPNEVAISIYIDSADECNQHRQLIKGGGGALTREKIIATVADKFVCIVDQEKMVDRLGDAFPLPIEVIPMARSYVAREMVKLGGTPVYREDFITDNGNIILDVHNLKILDALVLEQQINNLVGVVTNGLFAQRTADELLIASEAGIEVVRA